MKKWLQSNGGVPQENHAVKTKLTAKSTKQIKTAKAGRPLRPRTKSSKVSLDVDAANETGLAMDDDMASAASNIEHMTADSPIDPDFPMHFCDFVEWTNVQELARIELRNKKHNHNDANLVAQKARVLYRQFYKEPELRDGFPLNEIIWKMPNATDSQKSSPSTKEKPSNRPKLEINITFNEEAGMPVTYEEFERYTNVRDLAMQRMDRKKVPHSEPRILKAARKFYMIFFKHPEYRRMKPLYNLVIKGDCPAEFRRRILRPCGDETGYVVPPTSADSEYQFDESFFEEPTADASDDFSFPVTLEEFKKLTHWRDVVDEIIKRRPLYSSRFQEFQANDALRDRVLTNYYRAFYTQPGIRDKIALSLKAVPLAVRKRLLQFGTACASKRRHGGEDATQPKRLKTATDLDCLETAEPNHLNGSLNTHVVRGSDQSALPAAATLHEEEVQKKSAEEKKKRIKKVHFKVDVDEIVPLPVSFDEFERFTDIRDIATMKVQKDLEPGACIEREKVTICARKLYTIFYTHSDSRTMSPLNMLRINHDCSEDMRARIMSQLVSSPFRSDAMNNNLPLIESRSHIAAAAAADFDESVFFVEPPTTEQEVFIFPVSLEVFKKFSHCYAVVDELINRRDQSVGDRDDDVVLSECVLRKRVLRERVLVNYYRAFYTQPAVREKYPLKLKACPKPMKMTMLLEAVPKDAGSEPVESETSLRSATTNNKVEKEMNVIQNKPTLDTSDTPPKLKPYKVMVNLEDEKYLPVTFEEFDANTTVRKIATAELMRTLEQPSEAAVTLLARKFYITFYKIVESRKMQPLLNLRIHRNCSASIRNQIMMKYCAIPSTTQAAATAPETLVYVERGTTCNLEGEIAVAALDTNIKDQPLVTHIFGKIPKAEKEDESNECFITKQHALSDSFLLQYIAAKLPNHTDHNAILEKIKREILQKPPATITTASPKRAKMVHVATDKKVALKADTIIQEDGEKRLDEEVECEAPTSIQRIESIEQNADNARIVTQLTNTELCEINANDPADGYLVSELKRRCYGRKLRILYAVLDMSDEEFLKYVRLWVSDAQMVHNSSDESVLLRCKQRIMSEPHVWPKNLFVPLAGLIEYLVTRGVSLLRADLEHIPPQLMHWADIATCTNFDKCVRSAYSQRNGGLKPSVAPDDIQLLRQDYLERCCKRNEWIWRVPRITDDVLCVQVSVAQAVGAKNKRREQSVEQSVLLVDVMKAREAAEKEEAALATEQQQSGYVSATEELQLTEAVTLTRNSEEIVGENEIVVGAEVVHASCESAPADDYDKLELSLSKVTSTQRNSCEIAQVANEDIASDEEENEEYDGSLAHNTAVLVHRADSVLEIVPPQALLQGDTESTELPMPRQRIHTTMSPTLFPSSSDSSTRYLEPSGEPAIDPDASDHFVEVQSTQQQIEAINLEFLDDPLVHTVDQMSLESIHNFTDFALRDSSAIEEAAQAATSVDLPFIDERTPVQSGLCVPDVLPMTAAAEITPMANAAVANGSIIQNIEPAHNDQTLKLGTCDLIKRIKTERMPLNNCEFVLDDTTDEFLCRNIHESEKVIVIDDEPNLLCADFLESSRSPIPDNGLQLNELLSQESNFTLNGELGQRLPSFFDDEASVANMVTTAPTPTTTHPKPATSAITFKNILCKGWVMTNATNAPVGKKNTNSALGDFVPQIRHTFPALPLCAVTKGAADGNRALHCGSASAATAVVDFASNSQRSDSNSSVGSFSVTRALATDNTLFNSTVLMQAANQQQLPNVQPPSDTNTNSNGSSSEALASSAAQVNVETILCRRLLRFNYFEALTPAAIGRHELRTNDIGGRYMQAHITYAGRRTFVYANNIGALLPHLSAAELDDVQFVLSDLNEFEYSVGARKTIDAECDLRKRMLFHLFDTAPNFVHCRVIFESDMRDFGRIERVNPATDATIQRRPHCALKATVKPEILAQISTLKAKLRD